MEHESKEKNNWRYPAICYIKNSNKIIIPPGDIYEFGVFWGLSLYILIKNFNYLSERAHGLDSFEGLPKESQDKLNPPEWERGFLSCIDGNNSKDGISTVEDVKKHIMDDYKLSNYGLNVNLIDGFYCNSLTDETKNKYNMQKASIIDFDADQYTSTIESWEFICKNRLIQKGTLLFYDDWGIENEYLYGESRAHIEITTKYGVECELLYDSATGQRVFQISGGNYFL